MARRKRRGYARADAIRPGDVLWSDLRGPLLVVMAEHVEVDQVLFGKPTGKRVQGCRFATRDLDDNLVAIGILPVRARVQVVKRARPDNGGRPSGEEGGPGANRP